MQQPESLGLTGRSARRRTLHCLTQTIGAWPSAVFGIGKRRRPRLPGPGEAELRIRILDHMRSKGLTQKQLAMAVGVRQGSVSAVLCGRDAIPPAWIPLLERVLGVSRTQLLQDIQWQPRRGGRPRRSGPSPPRRRRQELPTETALRLRLRELIRERSLTQRQVASALGVTQGCIAEVLAGRMQLPPAWVTPLAHLLGLTKSRLIGGIAWTPHKCGRRRKN
jgi:predicted XRE-type DNA-binding protein